MFKGNTLFFVFLLYLRVSFYQNSYAALLAANYAY